MSLETSVVFQILVILTIYTPISPLIKWRLEHIESLPFFHTLTLPIGLLQIDLLLCPICNILCIPKSAGVALLAVVELVVETCTLQPLFSRVTGDHLQV